MSSSLATNLLIQAWGNSESESIKIAILLLSKGQQELFQQQLHAARINWRNVLMAAGMAFENWQAVIRHKGILPT